MACRQRIGVLNGQVNSSCLFCQDQEETMNHVLIHFPWVWRVWSELLGWWEISWAVPSSIHSLLSWWQGYKFNAVEKRLWEAIPFTALWSIWKARNKLKFEGVQPRWEEFSELIKVRVALWVKYNIKRVSYTINDFVCNLHLIRGVGNV